MLGLRKCPSFTKIADSSFSHREYHEKEVFFDEGVSVERFVFKKIVRGILYYYVRVLSLMRELCPSLAVRNSPLTHTKHALVTTIVVFYRKPNYHNEQAHKTSRSAKVPFRSRLRKKAFPMETKNLRRGVFRRNAKPLVPGTRVIKYLIPGLSSIPRSQLVSERDASVQMWKVHGVHDWGSRGSVRPWEGRECKDLAEPPTTCCTGW